MSKTPLAISLGDVTGIGPEVTLKALAARAATEQKGFVIVGDMAHLQKLNGKLGTGLDLQPYQRGSGARFAVLDLGGSPLPSDLSPGASEAANAAYAWLHTAAKGCLSGEFSGMVTAPVNKASIVNAGHPFVGQTELLSELAGTNRTVMMLLGQDDRGRWLRVALATTHVPICKVSQSLTEEKITLAVELAAKACADLHLGRQRVAVCGLNPHAGEGGKIGTEEVTLVRPTVEKLQRKGCDVIGPMSADALFYYAYRGDFDAVVAMYHDQGLTPLKMVAFEEGINWTLGLPFIRTSPDHGTAYDIAGKGMAAHSSMTAAINLALELGRRKDSTSNGS